MSYQMIIIILFIFFIKYMFSPNKIKVQDESDSLVHTRSNSPVIHIRRRQRAGSA